MITLFQDYKSKQLTKFEALYDLQIIAKDGLKTTTNELKRRWNWTHHSKVVRFLQELEKKEAIIKNRSNRGTEIISLIS